MSTYKTRKAQAKNAGAGESAQERALNLFADMMIEKIESIMTDWSKPWFTEDALREARVQVPGVLYFRQSDGSQLQQDIGGQCACSGCRGE